MSDITARGHDGLRIVRSAPKKPDVISETGVESEMLLQSQSLFLKRESVAPSSRGIRHLHTTASIIVVLQGRVRVNYGHHFEHVDHAIPGDFILIPAMMPHQPVNESGTEPIVCLVVRDAPFDDLIPYEDNLTRAA
ncbi:MAG: cupin domain-containing protein [Arthrospira platensis]